MIRITPSIKDFWEYTPGDSGGSGPCIAPPAGLVSWWGGDKDSSDLQGNNDGILKNGASYRAGFVSRAGFSFDGVDEVVQVGDNPSLKMTTAVTLEGWIFRLHRETRALSRTEKENISSVDSPVEQSDGLSQTPIRALRGSTPNSWHLRKPGHIIAITYDNGL